MTNPLVTVGASRGSAHEASQTLSRPSQSTALSLERVTKEFRSGDTCTPVLRDVTLAVSEGETVVLLGPSGSGKSTILNVAAGLTPPDAGTIRVGEHDLSGMSAKQASLLRRRAIGYVFQFFHLLPSLTVIDNVMVPLALNRIPDARGRALEALESVGLGHRLEHRPGQLSGGEMQRVAIARALVHRPRLLLADEPTGNLDSANASAVMELLFSRSRQAGAAMLMVTHDRRHADLADRVIELRDGSLVS